MIVVLPQVLALEYYYVGYKHQRYYYVAVGTAECRIYSNDSVSGHVNVSLSHQCCIMYYYKIGLEKHLEKLDYFVHASTSSE